MGNAKSFQNLTEGLLEEYVMLTYLSKYEIINLYKKFYKIDEQNIGNDIHYRIHKTRIMEAFPALKVNPFRERIFDVFSSAGDDHFSFEDMLDLCNVMSNNCPDKVKAQWAFRIYNFNTDDHNDEEHENEVLNKIDIYQILDNLTVASGKKLHDNEKDRIANELLEVINIQRTNGITKLEFEHAISKMSEFTQSFRCNF